MVQSACDSTVFGLFSMSNGPNRADLRYCRPLLQCAAARFQPGYSVKAASIKIHKRLPVKGATDPRPNRGRQKIGMLPEAARGPDSSHQASLSIAGRECTMATCYVAANSNEL